MSKIAPAEVSVSGSVVIPSVPASQIVRLEKQVRKWRTEVTVLQSNIAAATGKSERSRDFARGMFCATAQLINMHGDSTQARDLFALCGDMEDADAEDVAVFKKHGFVE